MQRRNCRPPPPSEQCAQGLEQPWNWPPVLGCAGGQPSPATSVVQPAAEAMRRKARPPDLPHRGFSPRAPIARETREPGREAEVWKKPLLRPTTRRGGTRKLHGGQPSSPQPSSSQLARKQARQQQATGGREDRNETRVIIICCSSFIIAALSPLHRRGRLKATMPLALYGRTAVVRVCSAESASEPPPRPRPARTRPAVELRRADLSAFRPPPWLVTQDVAVSALLAQDSAVPDVSLPARVLVALEVSPVAGGGYWLRGSVESSDDAACCTRCGASLQPAAAAAFQVLLEARPQGRRVGKGREDAGRPCLSEDDGGDVLAFPPNAASVDLSSVVRDTLLLSHQPPCCAACRSAAPAVVSYTSEARGPPASTLGRLDELKRRLRLS